MNKTKGRFVTHDKTIEHVLDGSISVPVSVKLFSLVCFSVLFITIIVLASFQYAPGETVTGYLEPEKGLIKVKSPYSGQVDEIYIKLGDKVTKGTPLFSIINENIDINQVSFQQQNVQLQNQQKQTLTKQISQLDEEVTIEKKINQSTNRRLKNDKSSLATKLTLQKQLIHKLTKHVHRLKKLAKTKIVSEKVLDDAEIRLFQAKQQQLELSDKLQQVNVDIENHQEDFQRKKIQIEKQRAELKIQLNNIQRQANDYNSNRKQVVTARTAGIIQKINVVQGSTILPSEQITIEIQPENSKGLKAVLYIPSPRVGIAREGQPVRVLIDAYPVEKFGTLKGTVTQLSNVASYAKESNIKLDDQLIYYRAEVDINKQHMQLNDKQYPLRPGLTLSADLIQEQRTLMEWIFEPLYRIKKRLLSS
ncbi:HlyD family secretion protein [Spartinivicinus poritis]|uniref:HlyD family efflux transporter periplasmic adaptor subunit n=1 Tax=Spartinivicinus poritis TaxID=2994640 RepID=A0ABT5U936_9GAMM|nr:HlyD family efflux transporter periplasmic adaptor subunit [Spartinivicinus sp. A2-2]MDE1462888.1 HlyD family efflux transporter periplasmic adaptor subunit [Spartinivicinus sp. A2-2]